MLFLHGRGLRGLGDAAGANLQAQINRFAGVQLPFGSIVQVQVDGNVTGATATNANAALWWCSASSGTGTSGDEKSDYDAGGVASNAGYIAGVLNSCATNAGLRAAVPVPPGVGVPMVPPTPVAPGSTPSVTVLPNAPPKPPAPPSPPWPWYYYATAVAVGVVGIGAFYTYRSKAASTRPIAGHQRYRRTR